MPESPDDALPPESLTPEGWVLLHEVRLRGIVTDDGTEVVTVLVERGLVARIPKGLRITTEGRDVHATWARVPLESEIEAAVTRAYRRFLPLNQELLRVCNDWQVGRSGAPNDHRDLAYDWAILDRVRTLDERTGPVIRQLAQVVPRFAAYRLRLSAALARVDEGEHEWLTSPRIDSYHTVWMQFHEDLLLALGAGRADEPTQ